MVVIQVQIQTLLAVTGEGGEITKGPSTRFNIKMVKLLVFNREAEKVGDFIIACKLYLKMKIRKTIVEKQI